MSNQLWVLAQQTVGTTATTIQPTTDGNEGNYTSYASVMIQADPSNSGTLYVGNSLLSTTRYSAALTAGQTWSLSGSAINAGKIYILGSAAGQVAHVSGS